MKDHRPSAVTATPNGVPGTGSIEVDTVRSTGAAAVATLQPGTPTGAVIGAADAGRAEPPPGEVAGGASMRPAAG